VPWAYIARLLGPGLHWGKSQRFLLDAIEKAQRDNEIAAAEHLEMILTQRNAVMMEKRETPRD
jgi:hypothetical protein